MTRKNKTKKITAKDITPTEPVTVTVASTDIALQTNRDMVTALLIVSLLINLFVLIGWIALQVTTAYDTQVASFLFTR